MITEPDINTDTYASTCIQLNYYWSKQKCGMCVEQCVELPVSGNVMFSNALHRTYTTHT